MIPQHFQFLKSTEHINQGSVGRNPFLFGSKVQNLEELPKELNRQFDRASLIELAGDSSYSDLSTSVSILGWGGMRYDHGSMFYANWNSIKTIIGDLRSGGIKSRQEAFENLRNARAKGIMKGAGVGYFTKLICFLNPNLKGYILDQWTGKSINLLWGDDLVHIVSQSGWVSDKNTPEVYEKFCQRIEQLADSLGVSPLQAEEKIFSKGGRRPGEWRRYLKKHY